MILFPPPIPSAKASRLKLDRPHSPHSPSSVDGAGEGSSSVDLGWQARGGGGRRHGGKKSSAAASPPPPFPQPLGLGAALVSTQLCVLGRLLAHGMPGLQAQILEVWSVECVECVDR